MTQPGHDTVSPQRLLTFASGGWLILFTSLVCLALITWALAPAVLRTVNRPPGDGRNPATYGFELDPLLVPRETLVPNMLHRDMVPVMHEPALLTAADVDRLNAEERGKYLVSLDHVVGVVIDGVARAYPISLLNVHEIIHDTLGPPGQETPIAVTYSWLSGCVRVFDRRIGGKTLEFGVSGLLSDANLLMYDRQTPERGDDADENEDADEIPYEARGESLWSQMLARAVAGPAAARGERLRTIPAQVLSWAYWRELHPETTVIARDPPFIKRYKKASPDDYFISSDLPYPAAPLPESDRGPGFKARVIAVIAGGVRAVYPAERIAMKAREHADSDSRGRDTWTVSLGGAMITFTHDAPSNTILVEADQPIEFVHALWFAWHAAHPDDPLVTSP